MNRKVVIIGEHPVNQSGFGRLNNYISTALDECSEFDESTCIGIMPRRSGTHSHETSYTVLSSPQYGGTEKNNIYGSVSLVKFLADNPGYTDVLCIGDPWFFQSISVTKAIFPSINFHFYCPVEGERLQARVYNTSQPLRPNVNVRNIIESMDNVIAYSHTGKLAINMMCESTIKCMSYAYHWVEDNSHKRATDGYQVEALEKALKGKFVVGYVGRNCFRKATDCLMLLAEELSNISTDIVILAHTPRKDTYGFDIDTVLEQLGPHTREYIKFTEDIVPDIFINTIDGKRVRDIKSGAPTELLEYLYHRFDMFLNISRAEGFGFPIAEAMVRGIPTLVNGYATPKEIMTAAETKDMAIPPACNEFYASGNNSYMGVPDIKAIAKNIVFLRDNDTFRNVIAKKQQKFAVRELRLDNSPHRKRLPTFILSVMPKPITDGVIFIGSYMEKCGIMTYTNNIMEHIPGSTHIGISDLETIENILVHIKNKVIHIQYEPALWSKDRIKKVIDMLTASTRYNKVIVTMHTIDTDFMDHIDGKVNHIIFHARVNAIKRIHRSNKSIITHPFPTYDLDADKRTVLREKLGFNNDSIVIGLNGFALPYKHLAEQATQVIQMIRNSPETDFRLLMVCSRHSKDYENIGQRILDSIRKYADTFNVCDKLVIKYEFLEKQIMAEHLNCMDIAFCYHNNKAIGSQSGSVRELVASRVITMVTKSANMHMHDDLIANKCAFGLAAKSGEALGPTSFARSACELIRSMIRNSSLKKTLNEVQGYITEYTNNNTYKQASIEHIKIYKGETDDSNRNDEQKSCSRVLRKKPARDSSSNNYGSGREVPEGKDRSSKEGQVRHYDRSGVIPKPELDRLSD